MFNFEEYCAINDNKYYKWYCNIITKRIKNEPNDNYCEKHHVIPKCIEKCDMVVKLTAREHFVVHLLLPRFVKDNQHKQKLIYALWGICNQANALQKRVTINSRTYEDVKKMFSKRISGKNHWMKDPERRRKLSEKCKGRKMSEETKQKLSKMFSGRKITWKDKISKSNKGKKRNEKMNEAQSKRLKEEYKNGTRTNPTKGIQREKFVCKYCGEKCDVANIKKWHNKNSGCVERLKKKNNKPGKRRSAIVHKRSPRNIECPVCKKIYTDQYFKKVHSQKCNPS